MNIIVAVDSEWGIGYKGDLLARVGKTFRTLRLTTGKTVILGSNTLATFPGGRVLKDRRNIVLNLGSRIRTNRCGCCTFTGRIVCKVGRIKEGWFVFGGYFRNRRRECVRSNCYRIVTEHILQNFAVLLIRTYGSRIWMNCRNGIL